MNKVSIKVNYFTHVYDEEWEKLDNIHCPKCGNKGVWQEDGEDYYVGSEHLCIACGSTFFLPHMYTDGGMNERNRQRIEQIKSKEDK